MCASSVIRCVNQLQAGNKRAEEKFVARYFKPLTAFVRRRLPVRARRVGDEEDVALATLYTFLTKMKAGDFVDLQSRDSVWKLLVTISRRKAANHIKREMTQKRGGGMVRGDSIFHAAESEGMRASFDELLAEGDKESDFDNKEWVEKVLAILDQRGLTLLRRIAIWKSEGKTDGWIALQLKRSKKTIQRRIAHLREVVRGWSPEM